MLRLVDRYCIKKELINGLKEGWENNNSYIQCELNFPIFPSLTWIEEQTLFPKFFWKPRLGSEKTLGIGACEVIKGSDALNTIVTRFQEGDPFTYYGGVPFLEESKDRIPWEEDSQAAFILPLFQWCSSSTGQVTLKYTYKKEGNLQEAIQYLEHCYEQLHFIVQNREGIASFKERKDTPSRKEWKEVFKKFIENDLDKVVLARCTELKFFEKIAPFQLLEKLQKKMGSLYYFCFQWEKEKGLLGGSPEQLYLRNEGVLKTEALAGTCLKSHSWSEKEIKEHQYVIDGIKSDLNKIGSLKEESNIVIKKFASLEHRYQRFSTEIDLQLTDEYLVKHLHPTAAVGGTPKDKAIEFIKKYESFYRGWYSAPVGALSSEFSEFCVAIRSALFKGKSLYLFSGAGITKESDEQKEWEEIEYKIQHYLSLFSEQKSFILV